MFQCFFLVTVSAPRAGDAAAGLTVDLTTGMVLAFFFILILCIIFGFIYWVYRRRHKRTSMATCTVIAQGFPTAVEEKPELPEKEATF